MNDGEGERHTPRDPRDPARGAHGSSRGPPEPHRDVGGLHRLLDHDAEVSAQRLEVDLLAQPRTERLQGVLRVVAAAVEAPVDEALYP